MLFTIDLPLRRSPRLAGRKAIDLHPTIGPAAPDTLELPGRPAERRIRFGARRLLRFANSVER